MEKGSSSSHHVDGPPTMAIIITARRIRIRMNPRLTYSNIMSCKHLPSMQSTRYTKSPLHARRPARCINPVRRKPNHFEFVQQLPVVQAGGCAGVQGRTVTEYKIRCFWLRCWKYQPDKTKALSSSLRLYFFPIFIPGLKYRGLPASVSDPKDIPESEFYRMEPHQQQPSSPPQHIPTAARHHGYTYLGGLASSSPTLCDKRLIRRSTHGTPYPQTIAIPPPPSYLTSGSAVLATRTSTGTINSTARTPNANIPVTPLLSLARRRRSTVSSSNSNSSPSPEINSRPRPMSPPLVPGSSATLQQMLQQQLQQQQQQQQQQHYYHFQRLGSAATTPGHSASAASSTFWGSNYATSSATPGGCSSLFVKDDMGLGGTWRSRETWNNRASISSPSEPGGKRPIPPDDDGDLELELEEAMDEDTTSDEEEEPKFAVPPPGKHNANGSLNRDNAKRREAEDDLARIAQAMTLLSLKPGAGPSEILSLGPHFFPLNPQDGHTEQESWPPHPTPESLLRESLRQSFEAYRTLKLLDKATVLGGAGARQNSVSTGSGQSSRRQSVHLQGVEGEVSERELSVVDALKAYEQAADGVKAAREVMKWAEHWIRDERERTRERLLKG
ncbi:hypothetical protein BGX38DRAFT_1244446 [Terfezia claveryi]|nr:hypothetical protein BGX38DRAFT_1244446 [Terfezia claveryi]